VQASSAGTLKIRATFERPAPGSGPAPPPGAAGPRGVPGAPMQGGTFGPPPTQAEEPARDPNGKFTDK
jgi:hypothetical protein